MRSIFDFSVENAKIENWLAERGEFELTGDLISGQLAIKTRHRDAASLSNQDDQEGDNDAARLVILRVLYVGHEVCPRSWSYGVRNRRILRERTPRAIPSARSLKS
jgi:hypothetical protein